MYTKTHKLAKRQFPQVGPVGLGLWGLGLWDLGEKCVFHRFIFEKKIMKI